MTEKSVFREAWSPELTSQSFPVSCFWCRGFVPHRKWNLTLLAHQITGKENRYRKSFFTTLISTLGRFNRANKKKKFFFSPVSSQPHPVRWWWVRVLFRQHHWMLQRDNRVCSSYVRECQVSSCEAWVRVYHCRLRLRRRWHFNASAVRMRQRTTRDLWRWSSYSSYLRRSTRKRFQVLVSSIAGLVQGFTIHVKGRWVPH